MGNSKGGSPAAIMWAVVAMCGGALNCLRSDKPVVVACGSITIVSAAVISIGWFWGRRSRR